MLAPSRRRFCNLPSWLSRQNSRANPSSRGQDRLLVRAPTEISTAEAERTFKDIGLSIKFDALAWSQDICEQPIKDDEVAEYLLALDDARWLRDGLNESGSKSWWGWLNRFTYARTLKLPATAILYAASKNVQAQGYQKLGDYYTLGNKTAPAAESYATSWKLYSDYMSKWNDAENRNVEFDLERVKDRYDFVMPWNRLRKEMRRIA